MAGTPRACYRSTSIVADGRLGVCDGARWAFVGKKEVKDPAQAKLGLGTREITKCWKISRSYKLARMVDPSKDEPDLSQLLSQARSLLEEIKSCREQAEAHRKQAEISHKNADSEALLAFNAKQFCEEHATTIAGVKGAVEADANAIATNKQRSDEALAALTASKAIADADMKAIEGRRRDADQAAVAVDQSAASLTKAAEVGTGRLKDIESSKESADSQATAAAAAARAAAQAAEGAGSASEAAGKSSAEAAGFVAAISEDHNATNQAVADTQSLLRQAQAAEEGLRKVVDHLAKSDEISTGHEKRVEALSAELQGLIGRVEGLLPGATSASLASSFNKQRSRFTGPQKQWLWMFVICIGLLVILALPTFLSAIGWVHPTEQSWRSLTFRLPIVLPIIWLAIYAGRNYMMSLRMEEDYAYKEAISTAFEGYKREMEKIGAAEGENPTPITILCTNILRAISERPGRIYEGRQKDINLLTEFQELAEKSADLSKKKLAAH